MHRLRHHAPKDISIESEGYRINPQQTIYLAQEEQPIRFTEQDFDHLYEKLSGKGSRLFSMLGGNKREIS